MKDKLNTKKLTLSLAVVTGIVSTACALLIAIAPGATMGLFGSIFHGIDITKIAVAFSWGSAILGIIVATALASVTGWLFATIYNKLA